MTPGVTERVLGGLVRERSRFLEFARGRVGADAEDVLQIALTRAVLKVDGLRDETLARPWFFRILRNAIADHHARGGVVANEIPGDDVIDDVPASVPPDDPCGCPVTVLGTLRPEYADILRRVDVDETPLAEVAASLDISANNAAVRLHRARGALRDALLRLCATDSIRACVDCGCDAPTESV